MHFMRTQRHSGIMFETSQDHPFLFLGLDLCSHKSDSDSLLVMLKMRLGPSKSEVSFVYIPHSILHHNRKKDIFKLHLADIKMQQSLGGVYCNV